MSIRYIIAMGPGPDLIKSPCRQASIGDPVTSKASITLSLKTLV
ncbi:hypothetical protein F383_09570 [Gossypium arboreum]|uniref:Uncharacterized protein n=1 Tax=Gossypium arboreum TaxID=29729 RepID=A0A0B0NF52_GOSAR|nr:hypothetical protein F383_09570 [Gossypium arboreum]